MKAQTHLFTKLGLTILLCFGGLITNKTALAQLTPDNTLYQESSIVNRVNDIKDLINGGAARGRNLFHSFQEFNVGENRSVYFANPTGIENILTRVTGANASHILGTLGVEGVANLYLLNPNGIVFGKNASLDIRGSFTATTADEIKLGENGLFSASNPQSSNLLSVQPGALFKNALRNQQAEIRNEGDLQVGQNLLFNADNLDLSGQLQAGGNLTLQANNTVKVRDTVTNPFIAAAGNKLSIVGKTSVDIFVLHHPDSGLFSGGDMVLRSANQIGGDAHFWSGGNFRIEKLDGSLGDLYSPHDPIIRSFGDVSFYAYEGASLHILAAGKVEIPGYIFITSPDTLANSINPSTTPELANVTLSDGTQLEIDGSQNLTVDIRAGMKADAVGISEITGNSGAFYDSLFNSILPTITTSPTNADIIIRNIFTDSVFSNGGQVLLTNQYQPNSVLTGDIKIRTIDTSDFLGGGLVVIDSRNGISLTGNINGTAIDISGIGADVSLIAKGNVSLTNGASINVRGGNGGNITIKSNNLALENGSTIKAGINRGLGLFNNQAGDINIIAQGTVSLTESNTFISNAVLETGQGNSGNININAHSLFLNNGAQIYDAVRTNKESYAGNINIKVKNIELNGIGSNNEKTGILNVIENDAVGQGGHINITSADSLKIKDGALIESSTFGRGNAGDINIDIPGQISLDGDKLVENQIYSSGIFNRVESTGKGNPGSINLNANSLSLTNGAVITGTSYGQGNGGNIKVNVTQNTQIDGNGTRYRTNLRRSSGIYSAINNNASGKSGTIDIFTNNLSITNGAQINNSIFGKGESGDINITVMNHANLDGVNIDQGSGGIFNRIETLGTQVKNTANINFKANSLSLTNGAVITGSSGGKGNGANITINFDKAMFIDGVNQFKNSLGIRQSSGVFTTIKESGIGAGGDIKVSSANGLLSLNNGGIIITNTFGQGDAGKIEINVDSLKLKGVGLNGQSSGVFTPSEPSAQGDAGTIKIGANLVDISDGGLISSQTRNSGDGGTIAINAKSIVATRGGQITTSTSSSGQAGTINVFAKSIILSGIDPNFSKRPQTDLNDINGNVGSASGIFVQTEASGNAGNINITTQNLNLYDGAQIAAFTSNSGQGGNINLFVDNNITLTGNNTAITASTLEGSSGKGGNIFIDPITFTIANGATVAVNSEGIGIGGDIEIYAGTLILDNGTISSITKSTNGGNISLYLDKLLLMENLSKISTDAGDKQFGGDGGNININSPLIVAFPNENSDITANANQGNGGNINITTQALFGLEFRPQETPRSDITVSSQFGVDGELEINRPDVDPTSGLLELPGNLVDAESLNKDVCAVKDDKIAAGSSFIIIGKGGLPADTNELISNSPAYLEWEKNSQTITKSKPSSVKVSQRNKNDIPEIQEAQGWIIKPDGKVILTANPVKVTLQRNKDNLPNCK